MAVGRVLLALVRTPLPALLGVSAAAWLSLGANLHGLDMSILCGRTAALGSPLRWQALEISLLVNPPARIAGVWLLMLLAMTPPSLTQSMTYLWHGSLARRRWRAIAIFSLGYVAIWLPAGLLLTLLAVASKLLIGLRAGAVLGLSLGVAILWQFAPLKRRCLNRCHFLPRLSAFGWPADRDCLRYGMSTGLWCIGSCWALMLIPLSVSHGHLGLMACLTLLIAIERQMPAWSGAWASVDSAAAFVSHAQNTVQAALVRLRSGRYAK